MLNSCLDPTRQAGGAREAAEEFAEYERTKRRRGSSFRDEAFARAEENARAFFGGLDSRDASEIGRLVFGFWYTCHGLCLDALR